MESNWIRLWFLAVSAATCWGAAWAVRSLPLLSWLLAGCGLLIFTWWVVAGACQNRIRLQRAARAVLKRDADFRRVLPGLRDEVTRTAAVLAEAIREYEAAHRQVIEAEPHFRILTGLQGPIRAYGEVAGARYAVFEENMDRLRAWLRRQFPLWWVPMA